MTITPAPTIKIFTDQTLAAGTARISANISLSDNRGFPALDNIRLVYKPADGDWMTVDTSPVQADTKSVLLTGVVPMSANIDYSIDIVGARNIARSSFYKLGFNSGPPSGPGQKLPGGGAPPSSGGPGSTSGSVASTLAQFRLLRNGVSEDINCGYVALPWPGTSSNTMITGVDSEGACARRCVADAACNMFEFTSATKACTLFSKTPVSYARAQEGAAAAAEGTRCFWRSAATCDTDALPTGAAAPFEFVRGPADEPGQCAVNPGALFTWADCAAACGETAESLSSTQTQWLCTYCNCHCAAVP